MVRAFHHSFIQATKATSVRLPMTLKARQTRVTDMSKGMRSTTRAFPPRTGMEREETDAMRMVVKVAAAAATMASEAWPTTTTQASATKRATLEQTPLQTQAMCLASHTTMERMEQQAHHRIPTPPSSSSFDLIAPHSYRLCIAVEGTFPASLHLALPRTLVMLASIPLLYTILAS